MVGAPVLHHRPQKLGFFYSPCCCWRPLGSLASRLHAEADGDIERGFGDLSLVCRIQAVREDHPDSAVPKQIEAYGATLACFRCFAPLLCCLARRPWLLGVGVGVAVG